MADRVLDQIGEELGQQFAVAVQFQAWRDLRAEELVVLLGHLIKRLHDVAEQRGQIERPGHSRPC